LENDRPVAEEQLEERLEHVSDPAGAPRGANEPLSANLITGILRPRKLLLLQTTAPAHRLQVLDKIM
jgi:hypothetical protein